MAGSGNDSFPFRPSPHAVVGIAGGHESKSLDSHPLPASLLAVALGREGPAPHLGNTVDVALMGKVQVSHPEDLRAGGQGVAGCLSPLIWAAALGKVVPEP